MSLLLRRSKVNGQAAYIQWVTPTLYTYLKVTIFENEHIAS